MDFGIVLFEALVYGICLVASVVCLFVSRKYPNRRIFDFTLMVLSVSIAMIFMLVFQVHYLMTRKGYFEEASVVLTGQIISVGYSFFAVLGLYLFNRFLLRVPEKPFPPIVNGGNFAVMIAFQSMTFFFFLSGVFEVQKANFPGSDFDVLLTFLQLAWFVIVLAISWKKLELRAIRTFRRDLVAFVAFVLALESAFCFIPDSAFEGFNLSRYLIDTSVSYVVFVGIALRYLSLEWKFRPQVRRAQTSRTFLEMLDLSPREVEVVRCLLQGKTNQEIAETLFISLSTVKTHLHRILDKTGHPSRTSLVAHIAGLEPTSISSV